MTAVTLNVFLGVVSWWRCYANHFLHWGALTTWLLLLVQGKVHHTANFRFHARGKTSYTCPVQQQSRCVLHTQNSFSSLHFSRSIRRGGAKICLWRAKKLVPGAESPSKYHSGHGTHSECVMGRVVVVDGGPPIVPPSIGGLFWPGGGLACLSLSLH